MTKLNPDLKSGKHLDCGCFMGELNDGTLVVEAHCEEHEKRFWFLHQQLDKTLYNEWILLPGKDATNEADPYTIALESVVEALKNGKDIKAAIERASQGLDFADRKRLQTFMQQAARDTLKKRTLN